MPTFTVNSHNLYYEVHGDQSNPPLVLLHEGLGATAGWWQQIAYFSPCYRVISFDRWGYGRSDPRPDFGYYYLADDAQETIAFLDHLGVRDAYILGHSDGGTIALMVAGQRPDLVRAMALEAAHIYYEWKVYEDNYPIVNKLLHSQKMKAYLTRLHGEKGPEMSLKWLNHWLDMQKAPRNLVERDALRRVTCPVLVMQGKEDEYATDQHAIDIDAALPNSTLWLMPGCGHVAHAAIGDEFNRRVDEFFERIDP